MTDADVMSKSLIQDISERQVTLSKYAYVAVV